MPPELIEDFLSGSYPHVSTEALKKADIWAAGILLYRLLQREYPVKANSVMNLKTQLRKFDTDTHLEAIDNVEIKQLLAGMLDKDTGKRSSIC